MEKAHWHVSLAIIFIIAVVILVTRHTYSTSADIWRVGLLLFALLLYTASLSIDKDQELTDSLYKDMKMRGKPAVIKDIKMQILKCEELISLYPIGPHGDSLSNQGRLKAELRHYKRCLKLADKLEVFNYIP